MPDPFATEREFQTLKLSLRLLASHRMRLLRIVEFFEPRLTSGSRNVVVAYLHELLPLIPEIINGRDFTGTSPTLLARVHAILEAALSAFPHLAHDKEWQDALATIDDAMGRINEYLHRRSIDAGEMSEGWNKTDGVLVPMVVREKVTRSVVPEFGSIKKVHVECRHRPKGTTGDTLTSGAMADRDTGTPSHLIEAVKAAKHLVRRYSRTGNGRAFDVHCDVRDADIVEGQSIGAGLAAEIFVKLLRLHRHREEFAVHSAVAVTGAIDEEGTILPVDPGGLKLKIEACTCSDLTYLVVPRQQEEFSRTFAAEFVARISPSSGPLGIIGAATLSDLFLDRRVTASRRIPLTSRMARGIWQWRRPVAIGVIIALGITVGRLLYGPIDKDPSSAEYLGEYLFVYNSAHDVIEKEHIGTASVEYVHHDMNLQLVRQYYVLADVDGDGLQEVIWTQVKSDGKEQETWLDCKHIGEDSLRWSVPIGRHVHPRSQPEIDKDHFSIKSVYAADYDHDGSVEIVLISCMHFYPTLVTLLEGRTGRTRGEYVHTGFLEAMIASEPDSSGIRRLIFAGANNAFRSACAVVIDPRYVSGNSPCTEEYAMDGGTPGLEQMYILFPRTVVGWLYRYRLKQNLVWELEETTEGFIRMKIRDVLTSSGEGLEPVNADIILNFNQKLEPLSMGTADNFDLLARKLYDTGKLAKMPDQQYRKEYLKTIEYWNGKLWQHEPVESSIYLDAVRKKP